MRNVSDKSCRENQNTHFKFSNISFPRKLYRLKDNVEEYGGAREATDENKIRRMRFTCGAEENVLMKAELTEIWSKLRHKRFMIFGGGKPVIKFTKLMRNG
jgi:hypothetical protein